MFNTFAVVEPILVPGIILPGGGECLVARMLNYKDMISFLETSTFNQTDVENCKRARIKEMAEKGIRVPEDCETLNEAVSLAHASHEHRQKYVDQDGKPRHLNKIVVGEGEHVVAVFKSGIHDKNYLTIRSAMHIVGDPDVPKEKIVVVGGIYFKEGIQGICHLQNLTLRQANGCSGVNGWSSFTMEDVLVEECEYHGVILHGADARCTDVEVRQCGQSGMFAAGWGGNSASITLIRANTKVHDNCTDDDRWNYGLVVGDSSTIQLVPPLTKEQVSFDNDGGGNWGAEDDGEASINQIKTIIAT
jgi:hypothetical protein